MTTHGPFGAWTHDENGLPCFDLIVDETRAPYDPLHHLIGSGRLSGFCDRWGNLSLFTCDGGQGFQDITRCQHQCRSAIYPRLQISDQPACALAPGEWTEREPIRYGVGYAQYRGRHTLHGAELELCLTIAAAPDYSPCLHARLELRNRGEQAVHGSVGLAGDCSLVDRYHAPEAPPLSRTHGSVALPDVHPLLGSFILAGNDDDRGVQCSFVGIGLERDLHLEPAQRCVIEVRVGYGTALPAGSVEQARRAWLAELAGLDAWAYPEAWMHDECRWALSQFLAFTVFDGSVGEAIIDLGGYGWRGFNQREVGENAMSLSTSNPTRAEAQLRWLGKRAWANGDHPAGCGFKPLEKAQPNEPESSDTELWFLLAVGVHCLEQGHNTILDDMIPGQDGQPISLWEHARRSWRYLVDEVGLGAHGLVRSWRGDWNDYLFPMGRAGHGESVKNSGMACRAGAMLAELARQRNDDSFAVEIEQWVAALRKAVGAAWTGTHFLRGYTDAGKPVGDDRVFINAQSWPALGGCGTAAQRDTALRHALANNATDLGLCLVNPPFPSPPPPDVSSLPIPPGEGENGGVWPQAVAWFTWALSDTGMIDEALALWRKNTLRHHYATYPETPFGIWNGPDCYNSHLAGARAHWTQTQLWDRRVHNPMNPSVAWQVFGMQRILARRLEQAQHG